MKKIQFTILMLLIAVVSFAQIKISALPTATGKGTGGFIPIVQGGVTRKITADSLVIAAKNYADSLKTVLVAAVATKQTTLDNTNIKTINGTSVLGSGNIVITGGGTPLDTTTIYSKINQNTAAIGTKQSNLQSGININTINGLSLLGASNIVIAGASSKALYKDLTLVPGGITPFNFDSSSTAKLTTSGLVNIDITGSVTTGSTGILMITQSATGNDTLKYNGTIINIGKIANKTSLVGFIKLASSFIFSVDTTNISIAQTGGTGIYDSSSTALFAVALTNASYKNAVNNAIVALKGITLAAGGTAWSKSVMINGRAGTTLTQQSFNWKNPAQYNYTYNGTFTYNANGTQFNGTNNYIGTGITPYTSFTGTSADIAIINVVGANPTPAGVIFGAYTTANLYTQITPSLFAYGVGTSEVDIPSTNTIGRFITFYSDATTLKSYRNATLLDSRTVTVNAYFVGTELLEGAVNAGATPSSFTSARVDVTQIINSKLTVAEAQAIDAVWATYQTALSR